MAFVISMSIVTFRHFSKRAIFSGFLIASTLFLGHGAGAQETKKTPYWASIATDDARMRKGPAETMPVMWEYRRENLPIKVIKVHENWRLIEDPDGTQGWMAVRLLSGRRTAMVTGETRVMRSSPDDGASVAYRAEPGVVGFLSDCDNGWCLFDVGGRKGFIRESHVWGSGEP